MSKYTRGPWRLIPPHCVLDARGYFIAATAPHFVKPQELRPPEERQANAHLIAASPDLLEVCRSVVSRCPMCAADMDCLEDTCARARAAIAKAEGPA